MREIKFRGFHEDENGKETIIMDGKKINGYWVYGYYAKVQITVYIYDVIIYDAININYDELDSSTYAKVIPGTIGQYIGIEDKNGCEIYDNDFVKVKETIYTNCYKKAILEIRGYIGQIVMYGYSWSIRKRRFIYTIYI